MEKLFDRVLWGIFTACVVLGVVLGGVSVIYLLTQLGIVWGTAFTVLFIVAFVAGVMQDD